MSPVAQVLEYKKSLYDFYSIKLAEKKITLGEKEAYNLIGCAVYFHNANIKDIKKIKLILRVIMLKFFVKNHYI